MAATLAEKRKEAKGLGIAAKVIRGATTVKELQTIINDFNSNGDEPKAKKGKVTKKGKKGKTEKSGRTGYMKAEKPKRGRPKGSGKSGTKSAPVKSEKAKTKRRSSDSDAGRHMLEAVDYSETDGWNPRPGSAPDRIVKALKKFRGNREKVFNFLVDDVWDFVGKKKRDGSKRTLSEAREMLHYRIARTDWEFARRTGQHTPATNRAEYGSGVAEKPKKAPKKAAKAPTKGKGKTSTKKAQDKPKRGRPVGSKNKPKATTEKPKRGRPKGSKNKRK